MVYGTEQCFTPPSATLTIVPVARGVLPSHVMPYIESGQQEWKTRGRGMQQSALIEGELGSARQDCMAP